MKNKIYINRIYIRKYYTLYKYKIYINVIYYIILTKFEIQMLYNTYAEFNSYKIKLLIQL